MNVQIKTFPGLDRGNHVIAITAGVVDSAGFRQIFERVIDATRSLLDCRVLIDLQDSTFKILPSDVREFMDRFEPANWPHNNKVALVSDSETEQYRQLVMFGEGLLKLDLKVGVFYDIKEAISWLAGIPNQ